MKKATKVISLVLCLLMVLSVSACEDESYTEYLTDTCAVTVDDGVMLFSGTYFATGEAGIVVTSYLYDDGFSSAEPTYAVSVAREIDGILTSVNANCNTQLTTSDVYRFNALNFGESVSVSDLTAELIGVAKQMYEATDGAFNPTVYRLVDLWGFSSRTYNDKGNTGLGAENGGYAYDRSWNYVDEYYSFSYPLPEQKYVTAFKQLCDFDKVLLSGEEGGYTLTKNCPSVTVDDVVYAQWLDLGGIAKGYAADLINDALTSHGITKGYVNIGTSSYVILRNKDGEAYPVGLNDPLLYELGAHYAQLRRGDVMVSTSGQYVRKYVTDGVEYSHIIDAETGYPADTGIVTVTAIGLTAVKDDCLTTALTVMNEQEVQDFIAGEFCRENGLEIVALHTDADARTVYSNVPENEFDDISSYVSFVYVGSTSENTVSKGFLSDTTGDILYSPATKSLALQTESETSNALPFVFAETSSAAQNAVIYTVITIGVLAFVGFGIYTFVRKRKSVEIIAQAKKSKLFVLGDIVAYAVIATVIVVLLVVFVFTNADGAIENIYVIDQLTQKPVLSFNLNTKTYTQSTNDSFVITCTQESDKYVFTIERELNDENCVNVLEIGTQIGDYYAKMISADCATKECIYNFSAITAENGVIVCNAHLLKVVAQLPEEDVISI